MAEKKSHGWRIKKDPCLNQRGLGGGPSLRKKTKKKATVREEKGKKGRSRGLKGAYCQDGKAQRKSLVRRETKRMTSSE